MDQQSRETKGEPGFMDIFRSLDELRSSLEARGLPPHLVILSGRTTRLKFIKELAAARLRMPWHRVRTLQDLLPPSLKIPDHENLDKLAVVRGAQLFCMGDDIRFLSVPQEQVFHRFIGLVTECPEGWEMNPKKILARPGEQTGRSIKLDVEPGVIQIGHAFRENGRAELLATIANTDEGGATAQGDARTARRPYRADGGA